MGAKWQDDAACVGKDPDAWFPDPSDIRGTENAISVCNGCPVRSQCLELALTAEADGAARFGIFGAKTPVQRARMANKGVPGDRVA